MGRPSDNGLTCPALAGSRGAAQPLSVSKSSGLPVPSLDGYQSHRGNMISKGSFRGWWSNWPAVIVTPLLAAAVLVLGSRPPELTDPHDLPVVGSRLSAGIPTSHLESKDRTFIFVSDTCALCRDRAASFVSHIRRDHQAVLVVSASEVDPVFMPLAEGRPEIIERIIFLPAEGFQSRTGVLTVPSYLEVDHSFLITEAGMSNIGWFRSTIDPRRWIRSWSRMFR